MPPSEGISILGFIRVRYTCSKTPKSCTWFAACSRSARDAVAGAASVRLLVTRTCSACGPAVDAKPVASSMSAEAQLAGGYEAAARPGLARSRTQPLVAHERVTPVRAPGAR